MDPRRLRLHDHPQETGFGCAVLLHQEYTGTICNGRGQWHHHVGRDRYFFPLCWACDEEAGAGFRGFLIELNLLERNQKPLPPQVPGLLLAIADHPPWVSSAVTYGNIPQAPGTGRPKVTSRAGIGRSRFLAVMEWGPPGRRILRRGVCSKMTPLIISSRLMTPIWLVTDT
jgi:hypothetical protein